MEHNLLSTDHSSAGQNHVQETGIANEQEEDGRGKKAERGEQALKIQPMISFFSLLIGKQKGGTLDPSPRPGISFTKNE